MYQLNNDLSIPSIGFGTWKMCDVDTAVPAVLSAIECGYRLIDTASVYENEELIGLALSRAAVKRSSLFLSGKVWNTDRGYEKTLRAFELSCKKLGIDYMDSYLIHWPASPFFSEDWEAENADTWRALEHLYDSGAVKSIGVCNYAPVHLEALSKTANYKPMINQIEFHPGTFPIDISDYCQKKDIQIEAWSPLGNGALLTHPSLLSLAKTHQTTPAKICLKWCEQRKAIALPKSITPERIAENIAPTDFTLTDEEMSVLDLLS